MFLLTDQFTVINSTVLYNYLFLAGYLGICLTDQCNVERNVLFDYDSWLGFHTLILDQCTVMREMECCLLILLNYVGTVSAFIFFTAENNSERVIGFKYFICLQTNLMWGNCDLVTTFLPSFLLSVYRPL